MITEAREADWWWTCPIRSKTEAQGDVFAGGGQVGRGAQLATVEGYRRILPGREAFGAKGCDTQGCLYIAAMPNCHEVEACVHPAEEAEEGRRGGFKKRRMCGVALDSLSFIATHDNSIPKRCTKIFKDCLGDERGKNS